MKHPHPLLICLYIYLCGLSAQAQETTLAHTKERFFQDGRMLLSEQSYAAGTHYYQHFLHIPGNETVWEEMREADFGIAVSAYHLHRKEAAERLSAYRAKYPYAEDKSLCNFYLGVIAFENDKFKPALRYFEDVKSEELEDEDYRQLLFCKGYCLLQQNQFDKASFHFEQLLKRPEGSYTEPARYYNGYCHVRLHNYTTALENLQPVDQANHYTTSTPYLIVQCLYHTGRCEELTPYAEKKLQEQPDNAYRSKMEHLMGLCSFEAGHYQEALRYLSAYQKNSKKISREDWYCLGISAYRTEDFKKAVEYLSKTTIKADALAQSSYFYIGLSDIRLGDKKQARLAFESAAATDFDPELQENALYNYALATYELSYSPFNESVAAFERFLKEFPKSSYVPQVYKYLLNVYLTTRNYAAAYQSIQRVGSDEPALKEAEQRVLFGMACDAIANRKYEPAIGYLQQVLSSKSYNPIITARAHFWYGECLYRTGKYTEAEQEYSLYLSRIGDKTAEEYALAHYNLGYACLMQGKYEDAIVWFRKYSALNDTDKAMQVDTYNRIGDGYFQQRKFDHALPAYQQAYGVGEKLPGSDYALYQQGFVYGLQKDYTRKISSMEQLLSSYPKSEWADDARFEIGKALTALERNEEAIATYQSLAKSYPKNNPIVRKSMMQIAMLQYNMGNNDQAITTYKSIIAQYPSTEEAETALSTLESLLVETNRVDEYGKIAQSMGVNTTGKEDSLQFKAAEKMYFAAQWNPAKSSLENYISHFPEGKYLLTARYYQADCSFRLADKEGALNAYRQLLTDGNAPDRELCLVRAASLCYDQTAYTEAAGYFEQLSQIGNKDQRKAAEIGLLRCAYLTKDYLRCIAAANQLISQYNDVETLSEARYKRLKSYIETQQPEAALPDMKALAKDTRTLYGAEAEYLLCNYYYDQKQYRAAEKEIFNFISMGTPHHYWMGRTFLLLSDLYLAEDNYFEAKQYLLTLRENYTSTEADIIEGINSRLQLIGELETEPISFENDSTREDNGNADKENEEAPTAL